MAEDPGARISNQATVLALAAALLGFALHIRDGLYQPHAIALLAAAFGLCVAATFVTGDVTARHLRAILVVLVIAQLLAMAFKPAGASAATVPQTDQRPFHAALAVALVAILLIQFASPRRGSWFGFILLLFTFASIGIWKIRTAPSPKIDVFVFQVESAKALAQGHKPYSITFANIYGPGTSVYGPGMVENGRCLFGYPYMPLSLLYTSGGQMLLGDFRYAQLVAMLAAAVMIGLIGVGRTGMLAAAMLLFTPRSFYVLESGWTEPLSVMLLAATVLCALRWRPVMPIMLGLLIASKQYLPVTIVLLPLLSSRKMLARDAAIAIITAALVTLPVVFWDVKAFIHSAVTLQLHQPYRADSLSLLAWWGSSRPGWIGPFWPAFVAMASVLALCLWRLPRNARGFVIAVALGYFAFFALNKQAFANYYYFVLAGLCPGISTIEAAAKTVDLPSESDR